MNVVLLLSLFFNIFSFVSSGGNKKIPQAYVIARATCLDGVGLFTNRFRDKKTPCIATRCKK